MSRFRGTMLVLMLTTWISGPRGTYAEPEAMARPTRPKVFTSVDELRRYLDLVRDYYTLSGKARYGKRAEVLPVFQNDPYVTEKNLIQVLNNEDSSGKLGRIFRQWLLKLNLNSII